MEISHALYYTHFQTSKEQTPKIDEGSETKSSIVVNCQTLLNNRQLISALRNIVIMEKWRKIFRVDIELYQHGS